ncbi:excisionase [[Clostridium] polysaccharolyticum]|uniref:DNA binding domain-containing protein, excisionase family n=1 Tax=[Clostridium] polysaccharolyticum TaxID=29364 RepID=A0A1I0CM18_9FIRM|nr:excisionase [[Clostridium] polysaccharolyticum]SET20517.1 DNA binding domain-containing protein, excisionase family [[Clostridium] polysaccharolyticum]
MKEIPIQDKYMLSIREASVYFNIGMKKLRRMAEDNEGEFALYFGNRFLICRSRFEEYLQGLMKKPADVGVNDEEIK